MLYKLVLAAALSAATFVESPPPTTPEPVVDRLHGVEIVDEYRWLEALEEESDQVREWTTAQIEYTRSILDTLPGREQIEARLGELMTIGSITAPSMRGNLYFYTERKGDQNQPVLYVREGFNGEPRVLLDPNSLDERGLSSLDWYRPSESGRYLAFGLSYAGDEMTVLYVLETATGRWLADEIPGKVYFSGWLADDSGFVYGKLDEPANAYSRSFYLHDLGTNVRQDMRIVSQETPERVPGAFITRDGRWILIDISEGWAKNDLYAVDADRWRRTGDLNRVPLAVGEDARFEPAFVQGDTLYMLTTHEAPNGALYAIDLNRPERTHWKPVIPERDDAVLQSVSEARGMMIARHEQDATSRFEKFTFEGDSLGPVKLPGSGLGTAFISTNDDRTEAFVTYTSFNEPTSIYRFDLADAEAAPVLWARPEVPVQPDTVVVKQVFFESKDGTQVPMFIVHKKGLRLDGTNPTVLYGYGGFNISLTPYFSATRFAWYEAGGVFALANLRGGSEYGESWHRGGMLGNKQNVFDDFYAAAEYLIEHGYTSPEHLGIQGGSNGGLLTGVAITQRPELFACAVSAVPLLDMLRYDQFLMARFWVPEYGSPGDAEHFRWLRAYSPYHNIRKGQRYPAMLFTAGENDNRVHPLHARKMTARMQAQASNDFDKHPILLWVDREAGHGSGKPLHLRIRDVADQHIFLAWQTGMLDKYTGTGGR